MVIWNCMMNSFTFSRRSATCIVLVALLTSCASSGDYTPLLRAEPEIGAVLERPPRTIRLFFAALPDVSRSSLTLVGPEGEYPLRGLHTMAADDLMIEILNPAVPAGSYTVQWVTSVGDDPTVYSGAYGFTVQPN